MIDRFSRDSPLEGAGIELPVPRGSRDGAFLHGIASDPQPYLSNHIKTCVGNRADLPKRVIAVAEPMRVLFAG